jgi:pyruvate/2-oxoglutarate dehydrogenase complex dihydrolipoamide acyltransferase (E2) component
MVEDVVVLEWRCAVGDRVAVGDALATVETDKADADVPSPVAGRVTALLAAEGDELPVGAPLCEIDES